MLDPLTALGLAANVTQFVSFASKLISTSQEIYALRKGCSNQILTLERTYEEVKSLSQKLGSEVNAAQLPPGLVPSVDSVSGIQDLALLCRHDCIRLLEVVRRLKGKAGPSSRWQSFRIALNTIWSSKEILELEERLNCTQTTLTLQLCTLASCWQQDHQLQLEELRRETERLRSEQSTKLHEIENGIEDLKTQFIKSKMHQLGLADIASLEEQFSKLSLSKDDVRKQHSILRSLEFESRPIRYETISEAHQRTFEWALEEFVVPEDDSGTSKNLLKWLKNGTGCFWISGKPGSGKSTFMKFIVDHPKTLKVLRSWSHPMPVIIASHFFWCAGTPMQRSLRGLLQTLLFDLFRQSPDLIELTCTKRWATPVHELGNMLWTTSELQQTLKEVARQATPVSRQCLFLDGLDEYEGDHSDFCDSLKDLSHSHHLKICVASRPWNAFERSFGRESNLKCYMHELTRDDIRLYTENRLLQHPGWKELDVEVAETKWLVEEITNRAEGVFLWVFLVIRELRDSLTEYDNFWEMRRRLDKIPTELEMFFKQILDSVNPSQHQKMATTLRVALAATGPEPAIVYSFHDDEDADTDYALKLPLKAMVSSQLASRETRVIARLSGRCRGLLEFNKRSKCIDFLHRTVMDFLKTPDMSNYLDAKAPPNANANISLMKAYTARVKSSMSVRAITRRGFARYFEDPSSHRDCDSFQSGADAYQSVSGSTASNNSKPTIVAFLEKVFAYAIKVGQNLDAFRILDDLDRSLPEMFKSCRDFPFRGLSPAISTSFFRELVIEASLTDYMDYALANDPKYCLGFQESALSYVLSVLIKHSQPAEERDQRIETLKSLLKNGFCPNTVSEEFDAVPDVVPTIWTEFIRAALAEGFGESTTFARNLDLFSLMIEHGAEPNATFYSWPPDLGFTTTWVAFASAAVFRTLDFSQESLYFEVLGEFVKAGADIRGHSSSSQLDVESPEIPSAIRQCWQTCGFFDPPPGSLGLLWFFGFLAQHFEIVPRFADSLLLAKIITRLLLETRDASASLRYYWPAVEKVLPANVQLLLRQQIENHRAETSNGDRSRADHVANRQAEERQDHLTAFKRLRSTESDVENEAESYNDRTNRIDSVNPSESFNRGASMFTSNWPLTSDNHLRITGPNRLASPASTFWKGSARYRRGDSKKTSCRAAYAAPATQRRREAPLSIASCARGPWTEVEES